MARNGAVEEVPREPLEVSGRRILVTGATGFVGSHVAEAFAASGARVRCTVRPTSPTQALSRLAVEQVPVDFGAAQSLAAAVKDIDTVVHLAALTHAPDATHYHTVNAEGTRRLAAAARSAGVKRFVFVSSLAARGPAPRCGASEQPDSPYGWSKRLAEQHVRAVQDLQVTVLRLAAVYGPRDRDMLPLFQMAQRGLLVVPRGTHLVQPLYVKDAVEAVLAAATQPRATGTFEVAEAKSYTWADAVKLFASAVKRNVRALQVPPSAFILLGGSLENTAKLRHRRPLLDTRRARDLARHTWTVDASPAERVLNWSAKVPLPEGLSETARWYRQQGWL